MPFKLKFSIDSFETFICDNPNDNEYCGLVQTVVDSDDSSVQIEAVKKIFAILKKQGHNQQGRDVLCTVLCPLYMSCPIKHPLKKLLASSFLGIVSVYKSAVVNTLSDLLLHGFQKDKDLHYRPATVNCSALMDNFIIGLEAILLKSDQVLKHLVNNLEHLHREVCYCENPLERADLLQLSLITLQVFNKLLQKVLEHEKSCDQGKGTENLERQCMLGKMCDVAKTVLNSDVALLDLRCNAAMTIILVMKTLSGEQLIFTLCQAVFHTPVLPSADIDPLTPVGEDGPSSLPHLCLLNGTLAMLTTEHLLADYGKGIFLTDVLGANLQVLVRSVTEGPCKLLLSRILVLFVSKCKICLKDEAHPNHDALTQCLLGNSPLLRCLLQYTTDHWLDTVDVVRHQANTVFRELVDCHLCASGEDADSSEFLCGLLQTLLDTGLQCKGVYCPLASLVSRMGSACVLEVRPKLHREILELVGEQALATYIADLYLTLSKHHNLTTGQSLLTWQQTWIDPVLDTLCEGSALQRKYVLEYIVPKLLKFSPKSVVYIGEKLAADAERGGSSLGALLMCLRQASGLGILKQKTSDQWKGVLPWSVLTTALCHRSEQVRLEAFGLLCENPKSTDSVRECELALILRFLPLSLSSQTPAFRQQLLAFIKKLLVRLRDSGRNTSRSKHGQVVTGEESCMLYYKRFLVSLCDLLFGYVSPSGGFPSRTSALALLRHLADVFTEGQQFSFSYEITASRIQTLLECLSDTFEENKKEAFAILTSLPLNQKRLGELPNVRELISVGLQMVRSTRPQDCTTAAYLLQVGVQLTEATHVLTERGTARSQEVGARSEGVGEKSQDQGGEATVKLGETINSTDSQELRALLTVQELLHELSAQLQTARTSLLHAAATKPMYPALHCVRYILHGVNLRHVTDPLAWRLTLSRLIQHCIQVSELVSPVVSSASPEGNVCFDENILGPGLCLDTPTLDVPEDSINKVNLMPEYLIVCCWRSVKEVSLLLGQLIQTAPVGNPGYKDDTGSLLDVDQVQEVGQYFTKQLLESVHRGAFELAYAGFVKMTDALWRSSLPSLTTLPGLWLRTLLFDLLQHGPESRLCATRRSAGLPFYVQAIISTETHTGDTLSSTMEQLLPVAMRRCEMDDPETDTTVHALNILRALFRDTRLGEEVSPFLARGLKAAILGYKSPVWSVRNSASLLYSALMTRTFGVKRSRDPSSKRNLMTGRVFFTRFPSLFTFLLQEIQEATTNMGDPGHFRLHPGLYAILLLLGKLYPATMETSTCSMNLSAFIPYVNRCAHSPVYKTRIMAARAISPLVAKHGIIEVVVGLLEDTVMKTVSTNYKHGALLQVLYLIPPPTDMSDDLREKIQTQVLPLIVQMCESPSQRSACCLLVLQVLCDIIFRLLALLPPNSHNNLAQVHHFLHSLQQEVSRGTSCLEVGAAEFYRSFTSQYLRYVCSDHYFTRLKSQGTSDSHLIPVVTDFLNSDSYEVQRETLHFLCGSETEEEDWNSESHGQSAVKPGTEVHRIREEVASQLTKLVMNKQLYPECTALTLECLTQLKPDLIVSANNVTTFLPRLGYLADFPLDEVRCAALRLMGRILSFADQNLESRLVPSVLSLLTERCHSEQSVDTRLACVDVLLWNTRTLLQDPDNLLGTDVFTMWSVLVTLLQDDHCEVRSQMADCLHKFDVDIYLDQSDGSLHPTESSLVLDSILHLMVRLFRGSRPIGLLSTLFSWLEEELEQCETEVKEVRLFDKGEMNTYRDDVRWVMLVEKHTQQFILSLRSTHPDVSVTENVDRSSDQSAPSVQNQSPDSGDDACNSRHLVLEYLTHKQTSLSEKLEAHTAWVNPVSLGKVFLQSDEYLADCMSVFRCTTAMCVCLLGLRDRTRPGRELLGCTSVFPQQDREAIQRLQHGLTEKWMGQGFTVNACLNEKFRELQTLGSS